jgi:ubiquitin-like protein 4
MTELAFAKSFLTNLDGRPNKLSTDHIEDPRSYPARSAVCLPSIPLPHAPYLFRNCWSGADIKQFILPKSTGPPLAKKTKLAPGAEASITVSLKSLRNPHLDVTLSSQPLSTSILNLKESLSSQTSIPVSALRILYSKKPVGDSKVLKDVVEEGKGKVEFSVMVIGGAAAVKKGSGVEETEPMEGVIRKGEEVLKTEEFWSDLKGFLVQRLNDEGEGEGERVWGVFKAAVDKR